MAKLVILIASWGITGSYWVSACFPMLVGAALFSLEKNMVVAMLARKTGSRTEHERLSAAWRVQVVS